MTEATVEVTETSLESRPMAISSIVEKAGYSMTGYAIDGPVAGAISNAISGVYNVEPAPPTMLTNVPGVEPLRKPVKVVVEKTPDGVLIAAPDLDITESGTSLWEAISSFCDFFREDLEHWKKADDAILSEDAKELKRRFLEYVA